MSAAAMHVLVGGSGVNSAGTLEWRGLSVEGKLVRATKIGRDLLHQVLHDGISLQTLTIAKQLRIHH
jgi:hypothetical protein